MILVIPLLPQNGHKIVGMAELSCKPACEDEDDAIEAGGGWD
jgi:hypothetical protein